MPMNELMICFSLRNFISGPWSTILRRSTREKGLLFQRWSDIRISSSKMKRNRLLSRIGCYLIKSKKTERRCWQRNSWKNSFGCTNTREVRWGKWYMKGNIKRGRRIIIKIPIKIWATSIMSDWHGNWWYLWWMNDWKDLLWSPLFVNILIDVEFRAIFGDKKRITQP